jgi:hypothetical protein
LQLVINRSPLPQRHPTPRRAYKEEEKELAKLHKTVMKKRQLEEKSAEKQRLANEKAAAKKVEADEKAALKKAEAEAKALEKQRKADLKAKEPATPPLGFNFLHAFLAPKEPPIIQRKLTVSEKHEIISKVKSGEMPPEQAQAVLDPKLIPHGGIMPLFSPRNSPRTPRKGKMAMEVDEDFLSDTMTSLGGFIVSDGGSTITSHGVVYAPSALNTAPKIGSASCIKILATSPPGVGGFNVTVGGLTPDTRYHYCAYGAPSCARFVCVLEDSIGPPVC